MLQITNYSSQDIYLNSTLMNITPTSGFPIVNGVYTVLSGTTATGEITFYPYSKPSISINAINLNKGDTVSAYINLMVSSSTGGIIDSTNYSTCYNQCLSHTKKESPDFQFCLDLAQSIAQFISYDFTSSTVNGKTVYSIEITDNPNYQMNYNPALCSQVPWTLSSKDNSTLGSFNLTYTGNRYNLNVILPFSLETFQSILPERSFYLICRDINNNGNFQFSTSQWSLNEIDPINLTIFNGVTGTIQIASGPDNTTTVITGTGLISDYQVSTNITTANIYQPDGLTPIPLAIFQGFDNLIFDSM
jgi:hypothetical protein